MQVKTNVKSGRIATNHNEARVRAAARGLKVQTGVQAGKITTNHSEMRARAAARRLKVQSGVQAGAPCPPPEDKGGPIC